MQYVPFSSFAISYMGLQARRRQPGASGGQLSLALTRRLPHCAGTAAEAGVIATIVSTIAEKMNFGDVLAMTVSQPAFAPE